SRQLRNPLGGIAVRDLVAGLQIVALVVGRNDEERPVDMGCGCGREHLCDRQSVLGSTHVASSPSRAGLGFLLGPSVADGSARVMPSADLQTDPTAERPSEYSGPASAARLDACRALLAGSHFLEAAQGLDLVFEFRNP